jgi:hypothetical protein
MTASHVRCAPTGNDSEAHFLGCEHACEFDVLQPLDFLDFMSQLFWISGHGYLHTKTLMG